MNEIFWPDGYLPGTTDNFASNEAIVAGLSAADVWPLLADATQWPGYYANATDLHFHEGRGPVLAAGDRFFFKTFGFPVEAQVTEYLPPAGAGRAAWRGTAGPGSKAPTRGWTCFTPGWSRICPAAACGCSLRRRNAASPRRHWPGPGPTR